MLKKSIALAAVLVVAAAVVATAGSHGNNGQEKVTLCHVPPGNPDNAHTITVGAPAAAAHLANHAGDAEGACPTITGPARVAPPKSKSSTGGDAVQLGRRSSKR